MRKENISLIEKKENTLLEDVVKGLSSSPKYIPSRYFYNEEGDRLFQKIMALEEYYVTRSEFEILEQYSSQICEIFAKEEEGIDIIELGAGDGIKTRLLLEGLINKNINFDYYPVDISANALEVVSTTMKISIPSISIIPVQDEYFSALNFIGQKNSKKKVVLFLGANIGNLNNEEVDSFLSGLHQNLQPGDLLLIGFDLKKEPATILSAYNDTHGVTAEFNFNLLKRINEELQADFNINTFSHYPTYDPLSGETKSFLVSKIRQKVRIKAADFILHLEPWEPIQTELSKKFSLDEIALLSLKNDFQIVGNFYDKNKYFVNTIWRKSLELF